MGARFRKIVRIFPGIRLNFSKSGGSLSLGGRGLSVNMGRDGIRTTAGVPGSSLSYATPRAPWATPSNTASRWIWLAALVALAVLAILALSP